MYVSLVTFSDHIETLGAVMTELKRHGLKLNPWKCTLMKNNIEYLGFLVGHLGNGRWGYQPLQAKIKAIQECPLPSTAKEVRQFCGSLQYYNSIILGLNIQLSPYRDTLVYQIDWTPVCLFSLFLHS